MQVICTKLLNVEGQNLSQDPSELKRGETFLHASRYFLNNPLPRFPSSPEFLNLPTCKNNRDHYFNKKEKQNQIPWPGRTLLGQHFWGSLNVSQVFQ